MDSSADGQKKANDTIAKKQGEESGSAEAANAIESSAGDKKEGTTEGGAPTLLDQMYSSSSHLMNAIEATNATKAKRKRTQQELAEEKVAANRRSAKESRNRKKLIFEELQRSVARLAQENSELRKENEQVKAELVALKAQFGILNNAAAVPGTVVSAQQQPIAQFDSNVNSAGQLPLDGSAGLQQQLALLQAAQASQQQQQQQQMLLAALGGGQPNAPQPNIPQGAPTAGAVDSQDRLNLFQQRVDERSQLIQQLASSLPGAGGATAQGHGQDDASQQQQQLLLQQFLAHVTNATSDQPSSSSAHQGSL